MSDDIYVRQLIEDLRGGVPPKCDFCHRHVAKENLHLEEGGRWACITCMRCCEIEEAQFRREHASPFVGCVAFVATVMTIAGLIAAALFC